MLFSHSALLRQAGSVVVAVHAARLERFAEAEIVGERAGERHRVAEFAFRVVARGGVDREIHTAAENVVHAHRGCPASFCKRLFQTCVEVVGRCHRNFAHRDFVLSVI